MLSFDLGFALPCVGSHGETQCLGLMDRCLGLFGCLFLRCLLIFLDRLNKKLPCLFEILLDGLTSLFY